MPPPNTTDSAPRAGPEVSVAIISKGRHAELLGTVTALRHHVEVRGPDVPVEFLVIEEAEEPDPVPGVRYRHLPKRDLGFGFARNQALRAARGRIIVFVDDDVTPSEKWLKHLLAPFRDPAVVGVGGGVIPSPDGLGPVGGALGLLGFPAGGPLRIPRAWDTPVETSTLSTTNCAFRRSAWEESGGFDESFVYGCEDSDFFQRLSAHGKLLYYGRAFVYHRQREQLGRVFRWGVRRGMGYFCLDCTRRGPMFSLLGPVRRSILPKLVLAIAFSLWFALRYTPLLGGAIALFLCILWALLAIARILSHLNPLRQIHTAELLAAFPLIITPKAVLVSPVIKLLVDVGEACGRWRMGRLYFRRRFREPPAIHLFAPEKTVSSAPALARSIRSYAERFRGAGGRVTTVSELVRRLGESPHTLFFQPMAALAVRLPDAAQRNALRSLLIDGVPLAFLLPAPAPSSGNSSTAAEEAEDRELTADELRELERTGAEITAFIAPEDASPDRLDAILARFKVALGHAPAGVALASSEMSAAVRENLEKAGVSWRLTARNGRIHLNLSPFDLPCIPAPDTTEAGQNEPA